MNNNIFQLNELCDMLCKILDYMKWEVFERLALVDTNRDYYLGAPFINVQLLAEACII